MKFGYNMEKSMGICKRLKFLPKRQRNTYNCSEICCIKLEIWHD